MRRRRVTLVLALLVGGAMWLLTSHPDLSMPTPQPVTTQPASTKTAALSVLDTLPVKGRAPKTGYARTQFSSGWETTDGCDTRNRILQRDLTDTVMSNGCLVMSGVLHDPYTGKIIQFTRGAETSSAVQIDHVVALGDAWVTGAQGLPADTRKSLANDPLELLAVDGPANQQKSDSDAASWLPPNKAFRCQYVARQIAVKVKYHLYVTAPEKQTMQQVLGTCPNQSIPE